MLKALLLPLLLALAAMATAQINLVPNGSFEDTVNCYVYTQCMLLKAEHWRNPTMSTPDVKDCDLDRQCGHEMAPDGPIGSYYPASDGDRFAGGYFWYGPGSSHTREYFMVRLTEPMQGGHAYRVGLHYVLPIRKQFAVDHIGVWFGMDSLSEETTFWLSVTPQIRLMDPDLPYMAEQNTWKAVADTFIAQGGEQWMVIGNFDPADQVNGFNVNPDAWDNHAYYYLDQVEVIPTSHVASVGELIGNFSPFGLWLYWNDGEAPERISIYESTGRLVFEGGPSLSFPLQMDLPNGLYVVKANKEGRSASLKLYKGESVH